MAQWMSDEVFKAYTTYSVLVVVKMALMLLLTLPPRPEQVRRQKFGIKYNVSEDKLQVFFGNDKVARQRCHLKELENVLPFVMIGLFYALSGPQPSTAFLHFRVFAGCQIAHIIEYVFGLPQPSRGLTSLVSYGVTLSMAYSVLSTVFQL